MATLNNVRLLQETSVVHPHRTTAYHGETVNFSIDFRNYGAQVNLAGATAALYWRVPSDEEGYWHQATASCSGSTAEWAWDATMDNGESPVIWFLKVDADDSNETTSYRATGELRLLASPGFTPAVIPPARMTLDFDLINVLHAPYYTKAEADGRYASGADVELHEHGFGEWAASPSDLNGQTVSIVADGTGWAPSVGGAIVGETKGSATSSSLSWGAGEWSGHVALTASRTRPYSVLGNQTEKPLAPRTHYHTIDEVENAAPLSAFGENPDQPGNSAPLYGLIFSDGHVRIYPGTGLEFGIENRALQIAASTLSAIYTQSDWAETGTSALSYIKNKPVLPTAETWTFEVDDGQGGTETVTKSVAVFAAQNAQAAQGGA